MRRIEKEMIQAINARRNWKKANTEVWQTSTARGDEAEVYLHGNLIAVINYNRGTRQFYSGGGWFTTTTKSRLNALGAFIKQRNFDWYNPDGSRFTEGQEIKY